MIRAWFGLEKNPFAAEHISLLPQQEEILATLLVHSQQGGLCLVLGEPGTGKSVLRQVLPQRDTRNIVSPLVTRTMHTYSSVLRILCQACGIELSGRDTRCERDLIAYGVKISREAKMLVPIIDDAHLLDIHCLRKLRLLFEEFPKSHNLVLVGQTSLLDTVRLSVNEDIRSRITYSALLARLAPDDSKTFVLNQLDRAGLGHNAFTEDALSLIVRSAEGVVRYLRNLAMGALVEAYTMKKREVDIAEVNRVLIQPHWRKGERELERR